MRICVLKSSYGGSSSIFKSYDPDPDPSPYLLDHDVEVVAVHKATAEQQVRALAPHYDVFVNLCDGAADEETAGVEVVRALERHGLAFTGAASADYDPSRAAMKAACARAGVDAPRSAVVGPGVDAARACEGLRFPMIVKHPAGYGSLGLSASSRVEDPAALAERAAETARLYGSALVEEFIEGREFTVLVAEASEPDEAPRGYAPVEVVFPPGECFKHFELKWISYGRMAYAPVDAALAARLCDASRRFFAALGATGYGRCDLRMDRDGRLFMLEINPNCGVFYPAAEPGCADVILTHDPAGHRGFLEHLLRCAANRRPHGAPSRDPAHLAAPSESPRAP
jgi:D-alanine-D-alanine ligase